MEKFIVKKSKGLSGQVKISGSKNAALPILAAALLCSEPVRIDNVPTLTDIDVMLDLLRCFGAEIKPCGGMLTIDCRNTVNSIPDYRVTKKIRASFLLAGALLGRFGFCSLPLPGGCSIGLRPIDLHLKGFAAMGAKIATEHGLVTIKAKKLHGSSIYLDFPSVGATENIMLAAVLAEGRTFLNNCATEPEIVDLAGFLNAMGAKIEGAGTDSMTIEGVKELHGCTYKIIPDRIEAGTYMLMAAAVRDSEIRITNVIPQHISPIIHKLTETGIQVITGDNFIRVISGREIHNTDIKTLPYPGFPTDLQAQFMALMTTGTGSGLVKETVFENRFMYVAELNRMGADIKIDGRSAIVNGVKHLSGTNVKATDLRAGAALIIAALTAEGQTEIGEICHIDRGYVNIEKKLTDIGVDIKRIKEGDDGECTE
ncbi:MAG: UDP-N-acetylglucosamine 1-carboxyvinyltransferase [Firmicutes bacterium]|nr:UDP-N-acetylglucosamine 1-carboxyvinyltransferase [Bacillota bacterium]